MRICLKGLILLLLCSFSVHAKTHTMIDMESCVRDATHVVVVTEGDRIDGHVIVLESWRGDLKPGDSLDIPVLAKFKSKKSRHIECEDCFGYLGKCLDATPKFVSGSRIILFLQGQTGRSDPQKWFAIGAAWIERWQTYALYDLKDVWDGTFTAYPAYPEGYLRYMVARVAYERAG